MTKTLPQISILGCGWLGLPLAESLVQQGYRIKGSTTSRNRLPELLDAGITPYVLFAGEDGLDGPVADFLEKSDILVIDIPPGLRKEADKDYTRVVSHILKAANTSQIQHILYISSTSVFPDANRTFRETDDFDPDTRAGEQLRNAEKLVMNPGITSNTILRFGGLIGGERHPARFLSGKKDLPGGDHRINLIHRDDCIGLILSVIRKNFWGHTLHGVAPCHQAKRTYYTAAATQMQLPPPEFRDDRPEDTGKIISGEQTAEWLGYTFLHTLC